MASKSSDSRVVSDHKVPTSVLEKIFDFDNVTFKGDDQLAWRQFYSSLGPIKVVTRSNKPNKKAINILGKHTRRKGRKWCRTSYNFVGKLPKKAVHA